LSFLEKKQRNSYHPAASSSITEKDQTTKQIKAATLCYRLEANIMQTKEEEA